MTTVSSVSHLQSPYATDSDKATTKYTNHHTDRTGQTRNYGFIKILTRYTISNQSTSDYLLVFLSFLHNKVTQHK